MNEILSKQELAYLTSYKSNKSIMKWLNKNRVPYMLSGEGMPLVNRNALASLMGDPSVTKQTFQAKDVDFSKLEGFT